MSLPAAVPASVSATTRGVSPRVALVTCADLPDLDTDDRLLIEPLTRRGVRVEVAVWDDPAVDWAGYQLAVLRSPWDYPLRRDEFVAWAAGVPRLANPADTVRWNTDKRYLDELAAAGVPVVPTQWVTPDDPHWVSPLAGAYVIKPAVSGGSQDSGRYELADAEHRRLAGAHLDRLRAAGRVAMVQPYLPAVARHGETALLYLGGRFSHAIRKGPMLAGPDTGADGLYKPEEITPRRPTEAERAVADQVLSALPGAADLLYARVDLIPAQDGRPLLVEVELTEPSLFLAYSAGAAERFADAITARLS